MIRLTPPPVSLRDYRLKSLIQDKAAGCRLRQQDKIMQKEGVCILKMTSSYLDLPQLVETNIPWRMDVAGGSLL